MEYTTLITDTLGGTLLQRMEGTEKPSGGTFATRINGIETGQHTFQLGGTKLSKADWQDLVDPWRRTIDIDRGTATPYSGVVMGHNWDEDTETLTVATADPRAFLARRMLFPIGGYSFGTRAITGKSLRGMLNEVIRLCSTGAYSSVWDLPFAFQPFDESGIEARIYWNYLFENGETIATDLTDTDGGSDLHFQRQIASSGRREWLVRTGDPHLSGPGKEYHGGKVKKPTAEGIKRATSGAEMVTGIFSIGNGSEVDMKHGEAATVAAPGGYPSLDVTRQYKNVDDVDLLNAVARSERDTFAIPTRQDSYRVPADSFFPDGLPGSPVRLFTHSSKFMPDVQDLRCIGYQGDITSEFITLDTQKAA